MSLPEAFKCPACGSPNIEEDDPGPGEHTCRDCGEWIDEEDLEEQS